MNGARARRSRRAARRWLRRRQGVVVVGSGAFATAVATAISIASFSGIDVVAAAAQKAQSVADLLAQRSPGERTAAQLTKTKHKKYVVLAEHEAPAAAPILPPAATEVLAPAASVAAIPEALPVLAEAVPPGVVPVLLSFPGGGIFLPGPGGGGGGPPPPPPPPSPPPPPPPPPPAIPEPETWTMMLLGFGMIGLTLRRRRAAVGSSVTR